MDTGSTAVNKILDKNEMSGPFQSRQGKSLKWSNVNMTLVAKGKSPEKKILQNVWGEAGNETTAIMGPSGSGKTSLLNVLSGRARNLGRLKVTADVKLDGKSVNPTDVSVRQHIAFVEQDDTLCISATPREAIFFSAKLRLPKSYMDEQLHTLTDRMLTELGLQGCADTIIGGTLAKGISGGERKRTSVGVELVTQPSIVFLDEPTSGLDSFSALQLVQVLDKVARAGASVLFTIHQPQSDIFDMFDRMILINKGQVMYQGDVENVTDYFESRGHPLPPKYNPADYVMIVAQTIPENELKEAGFFSEREEADSSSERSVLEYDTKNEHSRHVGAWIQVKYLVQRDFQSLVRVKTILGARLALTGFMTVLTGFIFWQVGDGNLEDRVEVQSIFGGLVTACMLAMFGSAMPTLIVFPEERPVFLREYATNHYSVVSYFLSRLLLEAILTAIQMVVLAILSYFMMALSLDFGLYFITLYTLAMSSTALAMVIGSTVEDPKIAVEFLPITLVPQIMFAGFFIAPDLIPVWLRWLQYIMPLSYAVNLVMDYEFNQDCGSEQANINCQNILDIAGSDSDDIWWYWLALVAIFVVLRSVALVCLKRKAEK